MRIFWKGEDPDSRDPSRKPVSYTWRMFNTSEYCKCDFGLENPDLLDLPDYVPDSSSFWSEPTTDTEVQFKDLDSGAFYLFGVRAIDEAGAVEPDLRLWYNVTYIRSLPGWGNPVLKVYEGTSEFSFYHDWQVWGMYVRTGEQICFRWEADSRRWIGTACGFKYGVDIEDFNDPDQWETDWSIEATNACLSFEEPGVHYLYIKMKDCFGSEVLGTVRIEAIDFFTRDVLLVDDYFDSFPTDTAHDMFMNSILARCYAYTDSISVYNTWKAGPGGIPSELKAVDEPPLTELSRYRLIIWDTDAGQNQFDTGLRRVIENGHLQFYLENGGRLWLFGKEIVRGSSGNPEGFCYPATPDPESFPHRCLKLSGEVNRPVITLDTHDDGFRGTTPNRALSDGLPILDIDYSKGGTSASYGMSKIEAVMTAMQDPDPGQRPDTLFFYRANADSSRYHEKPCGFRFHDIQTNSKVVYLAFPIHCFYDAGAESLATFVIDWMFEDMPAASRRPAISTAAHPSWQ